MNNENYTHVGCIGCDTPSEDLRDPTEYYLCEKCSANIKKHSDDLARRMRENEAAGLKKGIQWGTSQMTEVRIPLSFNEIEMLKDFMNKGCGIDTIALQWTDELYNLLDALGNIVNAPDFEHETWKEIFKEEPPDIQKMSICEFLERKNSTLRCPDCGQIHGKEK